MPRSYMFTKEQVLDAAIELTREKGFSAVSARSATRHDFPPDFQPL